MKKLVTAISFFVLTINVFGIADSTVTDLALEAILEESMDLQVSVYLFRISEGRSPENLQEFNEFLDSRGYGKDFSATNITFLDTGKVTYDFTIKKDNPYNSGDTATVYDLEARVSLDYFNDIYSSIHWVEADIKSVTVAIDPDEFKLTDVNKSVVITLGPEDINYVKSEAASALSDYEEGSPEYVILKTTQLVKEQDIKSYTDLVYPEDVIYFADNIRELIKSKAGAEFLNLVEGKPTKEEFINKTNKEVFTEFLNLIFKINPRIVYMLSNSGVTVIGTVKENNMVHVVTRSYVQMQGDAISGVDLSTVIFYEGKYYFKLPDEFKKMIEQLNASMDKYD